MQHQAPCSRKHPAGLLDPSIQPSFAGCKRIPATEDVHGMMDIAWLHKLKNCIPVAHTPPWQKRATGYRAGEFGPCLTAKLSLICGPCPLLEASSGTCGMYTSMAVRFRDPYLHAQGGDADASYWVWAIRRRSRKVFAWSNDVHA